MFFNKIKIVLLLVFFLLNINIHSQDQKEEEKELGWFFDGKLASLWTGGNSESFTFGLGATLKRIWEDSELRFDVGGTRTESKITTRTAVGTPDAFEVNEETKTEKTAELLFTKLRYDVQFSEFFYQYAGVDWLRNRFAGIESRAIIAAGIGNIWIDNKSTRFKTDYGLTYTFQSDVIENPDVKSHFLGLRFSYEFLHKISSTTEFESRLTVDWNLDHTKDVTADFYNALPISISEIFSLEPSLQLIWRNEPALTEAALFSPGGVDTGEIVTIPLKKLDSLFSLTLVVKI